VEYSLNTDALYDFPYENGYTAWFMNSVKSLRGYKRELKEFIMRLHTGETVSPATLDWTWPKGVRLGQRLLKDLAEDILKWAQEQQISVLSPVYTKLPALKTDLEFDGYIFINGKLYYSEDSVLDTESEKDILEKMIKDLDLDKQDFMKHSIELSGSHFLEEKWEDSIANSRKFLESVLQEIAAKHHLLKTGQAIDPYRYPHPLLVREYLQNQGLLEAKEKKAIAEVYGLLSQTGSHPYIAENDQARLMRYLALTFAQFALLRLHGFISEQSKK
jgi:hypothetical protein